MDLVSYRYPWCTAVVGSLRLEIKCWRNTHNSTRDSFTLQTRTIYDIASLVRQRSKQGRRWDSASVVELVSTFFHDGARVVELEYCRGKVGLDPTYVRQTFPKTWRKQFESVSQIEADPGPPNVRQACYERCNWDRS